jgi:hypothetical protein
MAFVPVDHDPFAEQPQEAGATTTGETTSNFVPVDHDPFAAEPAIPTTAEGLKNLDKQLAAGAIEGASIALSPPSTANILEKGADWLWNKVMPAGPAGPRPSDPGGLTTLAAPGGLSAAAARANSNRAIDYCYRLPLAPPPLLTEEGCPASRRPMSGVVLSEGWVL